MWGGGMFLYCSYVCRVKRMSFENAGGGRRRASTYLLVKLSIGGSGSGSTRTFGSCHSFKLVVLWRYRERCAILVEWCLNLVCSSTKIRIFLLYWHPVFLSTRFNYSLSIFSTSGFSCGDVRVTVVLYDWNVLKVRKSDAIIDSCAEIRFELFLA